MGKSNGFVSPLYTIHPTWLPFPDPGFSAEASLVASVEITPSKLSLVLGL